MMLTELCAELRNYFTQDADKHQGKFEISGGSIAPLDFLQDGQYFAVFGSAFNDGVWQYPATGMTDESFTGSVWAMHIPADVLTLAEQIEAYNATDAAKPSPYTSESLGGYSYTRAVDGGAPAGWQKIFAANLRRYRKVRV